MALLEQAFPELEPLVQVLPEQVSMERALPEEVSMEQVSKLPVARSRYRHMPKARPSLRGPEISNGTIFQSPEIEAGICVLQLMNPKAYCFWMGCHIFGLGSHYCSGIFPSRKRRAASSLGSDTKVASTVK